MGVQQPTRGTPGEGLPRSERPRPRPAGKTTLIKALTGDAAVQPRDQLFATLDITAHAGSLPCRLPVIYVDTIGFLSQLPHSLIESFSATLEDVAHSVSAGRGAKSPVSGECDSQGPGPLT